MMIMTIRIMIIMRIIIRRIIIIKKIFTDFSLFIKEFRSTVQEMKEGVAALFDRLISVSAPALQAEPEYQRRIA